MVSIIALLVVSLAVANLRKWWQSNQKWTKVLATIIAVDTGQDWKYGERLMRDPWSGDWVAEKTWQSYYAITAQWTNPQTQRQYMLSDQCWANEMTAIPVVGTTIPISMHPRNPSRYEML